MNLPEKGTYEECLESLDVQCCLRVIINNWFLIFRRKMDSRCRTWAHELNDIRNEEAHFTIKKLKTIVDGDIDRALDTMERFMRSIDTDIADQICDIKNKFGSRPEKSTAKQKVINSTDETQKIEDEIKKIERKINRWFTKKWQKNSKILYAFIKLFNENKGIVLYKELETESNIDKFKVSFDQMKYFGDNNNGKIFEQMGQNIYLWEKVEDVIWQKCKENNITIDKTLI